MGVVALTVAVGFGASAAPARSEWSASSVGGVFVVTYAPVPVSNVLSQLRVRFTTTGRAQPGWEYYVLLSVQRSKAKKQRCAPMAASWVPSMVRRVQHISGVAGRTYTVWLRAARPQGGRFCAGKATLEVGTAPRGHAGDRRRSLRRIPLTIVRRR